MWVSLSTFPCVPMVDMPHGHQRQTVSIRILPYDTRHQQHTSMRGKPTSPEQADTESLQMKYKPAVHLSAVKQATKSKPTLQQSDSLGPSYDRNRVAVRWHLLSFGRQTFLHYRKDSLPEVVVLIRDTTNSGQNGCAIKCTIYCLTVLCLCSLHKACSSVSLRATRYKFAPARISRLANAAPMPRDAPVITTHRPLNRHFSCVSSTRGFG